MRRTAAAYTLLLGLTAIMIGLYFNEFSALANTIRSYVIPFL